MPFTKSILLTNEGINQKTCGVKPLKLDPNLTTVPGEVGGNREPTDIMANWW